MPQSIAIGAFVFGAVLVLLALAGGGFKLFGAEVSGAAGKLARAISFFLGLALIAVGLLAELNRKDVSPAPAPPQTDKSVVPQPAPVPDSGTARQVGPASSEVTPAAPASLAGVWWDGNGTQYQIEQSGKRFRFVAANAATGLTSQGTGVVEGLNLQTEFRTSYGATGRAQGVLSPDGSQVTGSCWDTVYGTYPLFMRR